MSETRDVSSGAGALAGEVTFPMRPNKRRLLVCKSGRSNSSNNMTTSIVSSGSIMSRNQMVEESKESGDSSGGKSSPGRRRVYVSKKISVKEIHVDESTLNDANGEASTYLSPYGRLVARPSCKDEGVESGREPWRYYVNGGIIPYSILGDVDQLRKFTGSGSVGQQSSSPAGGSKSPSAGTRESLRSICSMQSTTESSTAVVPLASISSDDSITRVNIPTKRADNLDNIRKIRHKEALRRETFAEGKLVVGREERMGRMLGHERLLFDREERTLALHQEWQEQWAKFKSAMCRLSGKKVEDLVVSRADSFRERMEEYNFINAATPHHQKHGSEYWMMSLRGMGTRYVAVGNLFSGLFCPVRETSSIEMETIRMPRKFISSVKTGGQANTQTCTSGGKHSSWRNSKVLNRRKKQLAQSLAEIRPKELSQEDAEALVITGEPLLEWACVSMEERAIKMQKADESHQLWLTEQCAAEVKATVAAEAKAESAITSRVGPRLEVEVTTSDDETVAVGGKVSLRANVGALASAVAHVKNTGSTALYFTWGREGATADSTKQQRFFCSCSSGVVLPGETTTACFFFHSSTAGAWKDVWTLTTHPIAGQPLCVTMRGIAVRLDDSRPACEDLDDSLATAEAAAITEREVALAEARKTPEVPPVTEEELRTRYESANSALGLFFAPKIQEPLKALGLAVFQQKYALDKVTRPEQIEKEISADLKAWLATPSLVTLKAELARIGRGEMLWRSCSPPTEISDILSLEDDLDNTLQDLREDAREMVIDTDALAGMDLEYLAELDTTLMAFARKTVRRAEELSPFWAFAKTCILTMVDDIMDACEIPETPGEDDKAEELAAIEGGEELLLTLEEKVTMSAFKAITAFENSCSALKTEQRAKRTAVINPRKIREFAQCFSAFDVEPSIQPDGESVQQVLTAKEKFGGKRVLVEMDFDIAAAEDDESSLDAAEVVRKIDAVARTVDWVIRAFPKSIALVGRRNALPRIDGDDKQGEAPTASLALVCDELAAKLGREVVFVDDIGDKDTIAALLEYPVIEDEVEDDGVDEASDNEEVAATKEVAAAATAAAESVGPKDIDEIPVFMLENFTSCKFTSVIQKFAQVVVRDSLDGLMHTLPLAVAAKYDSEQQACTYIGPNLEAELIKVETLLRDDHVIVIGGAPLAYSDDNKNNIDEDEAEAENLNDDDDDDDEDEEEESEAESAINNDLVFEEDGEDPVSEEESSETSGGDAEPLDDGGQVWDASDGDAVEDSSDVVFADAGFSKQITLINGLLDKSLAKTVVLVGPLAETFAQALLEMGAPAQRLVDNDYVAESLIIPSEENQVTNSFECVSYRQAERENMRLMAFKARSLGVPVWVILKKHSTPAMTTEEERALFEDIINPNSSVMLFNAMPAASSTRALLRVLGKRAKDANDSTRVLVCSGEVQNQIEFLNEGNADYEIEQETADEQVRGEENAPGNEVDKKDKKNKEDETDKENKEDEDDEDDEDDEEKSEKAASENVSEKKEVHEIDKYGLDNERIEALAGHKALCALIVEVPLSL